MVWFLGKRGAQNSAHAEVIHPVKGDDVILNVGGKVVHAHIMRRVGDTLYTEERSSKGNYYYLARSVQQFVCLDNGKAANPTFKTESAA